MGRDRPRNCEPSLALAAEGNPLFIEQMLALIANTTRAVVYGSGLTALLQGLLIGIAFAIVDLPSPVVFGVLAALQPALASSLVETLGTTLSRDGP